MGTGAFANLREYADYDAVDAIVITHMHADHFVDVIPMRYALKYGENKRKTKMPLWLPPDGEAMLRRLVSAFAPEGDGDFLSEVFEVRTYDPNAILRLGNATLRFAQTRHYVATYAVRYEAEGTVLTYSADTAPEENVVRLARNSDLFLCEASLLRNEVEPGVRGHSSPLEAAQMAHDAEVAALMLTHYSDGQTADEMIQAARMVYSGPISCADDHLHAAVGSHEKAPAKLKR
jgi:ribonuclease BN (tRNA processing enzyme)